MLDTDCWKLRWLFANTGVRQQPVGFDPVLGWRGDQVGPDYRRFDDELAGRTPVLLYGDSFARCHTSREDCFDGLLGRSPLAADHALLNFGVGGYGLDQIHLMLRQSLDHYAASDPIVVVSLLVDNDLDRLPLHFRHWPKPELGLAGGRLVSVGPALADPAVYIEANPVTIRSYLWRYLLRGSGLFPFAWVDSLGDRTDRLAWIEELTPAILRETHALLEERGLRHVFVLFLARRGLGRPYPESWRESLLVGSLEELGAPWVSVRDEFERELAETGGSVADYFLEGDDHYDAEGNAVAFRVIERAIADARRP